MKNINIMCLALATTLYSSQTCSFANRNNIQKLSNNISVNAPNLSIYETTNEDGIKVIKVDAWDNDMESGIEKIEFPDGTFVMVEDGQYVINTEYIPNGSGTYKFKAYDKNGNFIEKSITITINDIPPMLDVYIEKKNIYQNTVTIGVTSWVESDGGTKIDRIEMPDGSVVKATEDSPYNVKTSFVAKYTGNYKFKVYDIQGLSREVSIAIQLDDNKPNMEVFFSNSILDSTKKIIHIDAWDNDDESGIHKVVSSDGTVYKINSEDQYSLSIEHIPNKTGEYTFKAYDRAGNFIEKKINYTSNYEPPTVECEVDVQPTKAIITLNAEAESGATLSKIKMPDGNDICLNQDETVKTVTFEATKEGKYDFMIIDNNRNASKIRVSITMDDFNVSEASRLVDIAERSKDILDIKNARYAVNALLESSSKDALQARINDIFADDVVLEKKTATANVDIYVKSENMLSLTIDTNNVLFDDFSGITDMEKSKAINLSVNSSLPYEIGAYLATEIKNSDDSSEIDKSILNIKLNEEKDYKEFDDINKKIILKDSCVSGNNLSHEIDLKLNGGLTFKKDVYKTVIKLEVNQK